MEKNKKPCLKKALKKVDQAPLAQFGEVSIDLESLPCLKKTMKEKITANFDADVLEVIRTVAKKNHIPYATLINDVLRRVFVENKKAS